MNIDQTLFLGIIQGLTEFLPISSSGHLVLFQNLMGIKKPELLLDISLHVGTLMAVLVFFRRDLMEMAREGVDFLKVFPEKNKQTRIIRKFPYAGLGLWVLVACIPTLIMGIFLDLFSQRLFSSTLLVGFMLIITGIALGASYFIPENPAKKRRELGLLPALVIGLAQGTAIIPGISRSGATIVCGLFCGLDRDLAGRFSFLLSIPAVAGAAMYKFDLAEITELGLAPFFTGILVAFLVGLLALKITMYMLRRGNLYYFSPYCLAIGAFILLAV